MNLGDAITFYRKQKGCTQAQLAEMAGTGNRYISRIENGVLTPKLPVLQAIADALEIPLWMIFYKQPDRTQKILALLEDCAPREQAALYELLEAEKRIIRKFFQEKT